MFASVVDNVATYGRKQQKSWNVDYMTDKEA
jgi:hypothetical protein